jgi:hypothetical protein
MRFSSWLKYWPLIAAPIILVAGVAVGTETPPATSTSRSAPLSCYMTTSSGARIRLDKICGASNSMENQKPVVRILPNGDTEVTVLRGQSHTDSDGGVSKLVGATVETVWPNGVRREFVPTATQSSGFQYYHPDGRKLAPGDKVNLPDGREVMQDRLH